MWEVKDFNVSGILSQTILRLLSCSSSVQVKLAAIYKRRKQKSCAVLCECANSAKILAC